MNRERLLSNKYKWGLELEMLFYCGWDHPPQIGGSGGIKFLQETKQRTCTEEAITGTGTAGSKGELEAQDKGGPRSQETKTVTDKISTRLKDE